VHRGKLYPSAAAPGDPDLLSETTLNPAATFICAGKQLEVLAGKGIEAALIAEGSPAHVPIRSTETAATDPERVIGAVDTEALA
jgi:hypothetical protein